MGRTLWNGAGALLAIALAVSGSATSAEQQSVTIGTGGVTGVYYPTGGAICRLVNKGRKEHGIRCSTESTDGSVYNLGAVRSGDLEFGIVQSDWQHHAYHGTGRFADRGAFTELRAVLALHPEPFTVVARADAGIATFDDLRGKRVNVGNPGSGQRATMEVLMRARGWSMDDFAHAGELASDEQSRALCEGRLDAIVYTVGHPSAAIKQATTLCDSIIVAVNGPAVERLVEEKPYYRRASIPGGMYRNTDHDVPTFGVAATLVTSSDVPADVVYGVVESVLSNFEEFRRLHPALRVLEKEAVVERGLSAPLHEGAARYYEGAGLL